MGSNWVGARVGLNVGLNVGARVGLRVGYPSVFHASPLCLNVRDIKNNEEQER